MDKRAKMAPLRPRPKDHDQSDNRPPTKKRASAERLQSDMRKCCNTMDTDL